jgi:hypothetical protein
MLFPGEEVCGGKGLVEKSPSFSFYLAFLVIIHEALGFPQGHLQGSGGLSRSHLGDQLDVPNQVGNVG